MKLVKSITRRGANSPQAVSYHLSESHVGIVKIRHGHSAHRYPQASDLNQQLEIEPIIHGIQAVRYAFQHPSCYQLVAAMVVPEIGCKDQFLKHGENPVSGCFQRSGPCWSLSGLALSSISHYRGTAQDYCRVKEKWKAGRIIKAITS